MYRKKQYIQGSVLAAFSGVHWGPWDIYSKTRWGGWLLCCPPSPSGGKEEGGREIGLELFAHLPSTSTPEEERHKPLPALSPEQLPEPWRPRLGSQTPSFPAEILSIQELLWFAAPTGRPLSRPSPPSLGSSWAPAPACPALSLLSAFSQAGLLGRKLVPPFSA